MSKRMVREDELAKGGWLFTSTGVAYWHDGIKNLRQFIPIAQSDWVKEDTAGTSTLDFPYDGATSRITARITPTAFGTHKIRKRILLPRDFGAWAPTSPITVVTKRSAVDTSLLATLFHGGAADAGVNGVSVDPSVAATYQTFTLTPTDVTYNPGDLVTFEIAYIAAANGRTIEACDLMLSYKTNRGNI